MCIIIIIIIIMHLLYKKVQLSLCRPGQALRVPGD
jgi:hypothetical protein